MVVGKVTTIKIGGNRHDDIGGEFFFVYLDGAMYYIYWSTLWPEDLASTDRLRYSMWLSILKDAYLNNIDIELTLDPDATSRVLTVKFPA